MNSKKIIITEVLIFLLSMTGCSYDSGRTENDTKYIPCVSLKMCEMYAVEYLPSVHGGSTAADEAARWRNSDRCIGAFVNDEGHFVVVYDKELLEKEYNNSVQTLERFIEQSSLRIEVNYDCDEIIYYVDNTTDITDLYDLVAIGPACFCIQQLSGTIYDDAKLHLKIIYEPTNEEMFNMSVDGESAITMDVDSQGNVSFSGTELTEEEFEEKLNAMKK